MATSKRTRARTGAASPRPRATTRRASKRASKAAPLALRRTPMQARGQATFERILDATTELLQTVGTESITTNLIARAADVNVATLYQYFPNKQAVLLSLYRRQHEARAAVGERFVRGLADAADWRRDVARAVQYVAEARRAMGGVAALRLAMRSTPELLEYERTQSAEFSDSLAEELAGAGLRADKAKLVARCTVEAVAAVLDLWSIESRDRDDRIVEQAKELAIAYLAPHLDGARTARRSARRKAA